MKSTSKNSGQNYDSDEEETNTNSFISKQESAANVQSINGQEYDVIDVGEHALLVNNQNPSAQQSNEIPENLQKQNEDRRGAVGHKKQD